MKRARLSYAALCLSLTSCAALLPDSEQISRTPWPDYQTAEQVFKGVSLETTSLQQLHAMGLDPAKTPNIIVLSYADLMRRLALSGAGEPRLLAPQIQACIAAQTSCFAYEIEQKSSVRKRYGNFWADFLNFERKTVISGWHFDVIFIIQNERLVYKLWSGTPSIEQFEQENTPLGPFQGMGISILTK
ncbi:MULTISPECIES: hypothetical protein [unclassified Iodobacter]|uniref:hypothetical protein n=1 Tax=unclassified Iodobacter TaxID=235634 RepID=UPI0025D8C389|nr:MULTISPECIES: hypothetical protein [unclassified Iodobacter]MDW5417294.1 hypothetical protein [Iodobacter sp. CM08]